MLWLATNFSKNSTNYLYLSRNCFEVDKSKDFESFLHHRPEIYSNKVTDLLGHEKENELFLIGQNSSEFVFHF